MDLTKLKRDVNIKEKFNTKAKYGRLSVGELQTMRYSDYLNTTYWKRLSKDFKELCDYTCEKCGIIKEN